MQVIGIPYIDSCGVTLQPKVEYDKWTILATSTGETHVADAIITSEATNNSVQVQNKSDPEKNVYEVDAQALENEEYPPPTEEEVNSLRKVPAYLPVIAYSLCLVEFAERASYYGAQTVFSNFIEFPLPKGGNGAGAPPRGTQETAGALGMGLQASDGLVLLFQFLAYVIPIFGGWWADVHVGRYWAICVGVAICGIAHIIQIIGAIPSVLQAGTAHAAPPFIIGLLMLALGAGIFKPNIAPTVLDQYRHQKQYTKVLKTGEKVIVDPEMTATRTMLIFYGVINVGAFYMLATTYAEKYVGYWLAFLLAGIIYFILPVVLAAAYKKTYRTPPSGNSDLAKAIKITVTALRQNKWQVWRKNFFDAAKPSVLAAKGIQVDWTDKLVDDVRRTLVATEIFFYFPIYNLNDGGIGSVSTNQGASMTTNGAPNDLLSNFNALTIIVAVPIVDYFIYPLLYRYNIPFKRITRITFGFILAALSGLCGALVQWRVYKTSPCGYYASSCSEVSPISIWWQLPNTILGALSEIFCNVTAYELAYARSPASMRGLVMAIFLFMTALSSALGEILLPVTEDPDLIWIWGAPAVALALQTIFFWYRFRYLNNDEFMTDEANYANSTGETFIQTTEVEKTVEN
ncbi:PTR2-domain-containing protein [Aspergillus eucalypticola CBS 122712]|uniref:PTR2-domain-containing protein n=1 Tax=Aspergillus eucalypticola (strain CBS 122712 / IBT 29274) TaxID=1448314 RepID=A0A317UR26_ASPEC|nr:PTR2-domain-containing protein [Aspergillus eucalypticola CBS 122712]PWY63656.1 PTR2-domain-containing protein [Aspergillus eucalypticola CBS 122712]